MNFGKRLNGHSNAYSIPKFGSAVDPYMSSTHHTNSGNPGRIELGGPELYLAVLD